jgi:MYXO-CTERM domain-containing protein
MKSTSAMVLAAVVAASAARACPVPPGNLRDTLPANGATWPANAAVALLGPGLTWDGVTATVDGAPVRLVPTPDLDFAAWPGDGFSAPAPWTTARLDPAPAPGAHVVVTGDACTDGDRCALHLEYTAGPADEVAPPTPGGVWFDLFAHGPVSHGEDCVSWGDAEWRVHFEVAADSGTGAAEVLRLEAVTDGMAARTLRALPFTAGAQMQVVEGRIAHDDAGAPLPEASCVRVVAYDLAGNRASLGEVCPPCHFIADEQPREQAPPVPAYGPDNAWPGGVCAESAAPDAGPPADAGPDGGAAESPPPRSKSCNVTATTPGPPVLLLALAFLPLRRRRR